MPPGSGESARARHQETPQEIALAKAREDFFVEHVLPTVRGFAFKTFRRLEFSERMEVVQESVSVCWRLFVRLVGSGRDPEPFVARLAWQAVKAVQGWHYLNGSVSSTDVLSRRVAVEGLARVLNGRHESCGRVERPDLDAERNEYLGRLSTRDQELAEFLRHNSVKQTQAQYGLSKRDLEQLLERLCRD
jgi:hypothetical protein